MDATSEYDQGSHQPLARRRARATVGNTSKAQPLSAGRRLEVIISSLVKGSFVVRINQSIGFDL
jgi:hypothetical protein